MVTRTTSSAAVWRMMRSFIMLLMACAPASVLSTPMLPFGSASGGVYQGNNLTIGYRFEVFSPIMVEGLGVFDVHGDGWAPPNIFSSDNVNVRLWTEGGARLLLNEWVEPTSPLDATEYSVGGITGSYRYQSVAPMLLTEGIYSVGAEMQDIGGYDGVRGATAENLSSAIGNLQAAYTFDDYGYPGTLQTAGEIHMGGSVLFEEAPAGTVDDPILPIAILPGGHWMFAPMMIWNASEGWVERQFWYDPEIAVGYEYTVADARFGSVELPFGFGDDQYELWLINPTTGLFEFVQWLDAGVKLDLSILDPFGNGALGDSVDTLRILGIETSELLDPTDTAAFPTGLTFQPLPGNSSDETLIANLTMQALTETVDDGSIPVPGTVWLFSIGLLGLWKHSGGGRHRP